MGSPGLTNNIETALMPLNRDLEEYSPDPIIMSNFKNSTKKESMIIILRKYS